MKQGGVLPDIDRDSIDRPIFVIGTGRSATRTARVMDAVLETFWGPRRGRFWERR